MAAARDQAEERRLERVGSRKAEATCPCRWSTPASGLRCAAASAFAELTPDQQRADQPGAAGDRERVDVGEADARVGEGGVDDGIDQLEVVARGDLGDDPAEALVGGRL